MSAGEAPLLRFEGIRKSFFDVEVLHGVGFDVAAGSVIGLVGENGAGKTTLMNVLGGVFPPDGGRVLLHGEPYQPTSPRDAAARGVAFIHQELNLFPNLSIADNLFLDRFPRRGRLPWIDRRAQRAEAARLLGLVDLDHDPGTTVDRLPPGERQLVEIAKALGGDARVIIFDEPTTSLTARETARLFELIRRLRGEGTAVLYISHILDDVLALADHVVVLRDGALVDQGPRAAFTADRMIAAMVGRRLEQLYPERTATPSGEVLLRVEELSQPGVVADIDLVLHRGEVLGLFGLMGSGRTELARILFGLDPYERGRIEVAGEQRTRRTARSSIAQRMAFVTEDRRDEGLLMDGSIADNIALVALPDLVRALGVVDDGRVQRSARDVGGKLHLRADRLDRRAAKSLSGGNQQKVVLAKWLLAEPRVFLLDEPTRGVDVGAKHEVYTVIDQLAAGGAGVLVISSELEELMGICDRVLVLRGGELTGAFDRADFDGERILRAAFGEEPAVRS